MSLLFDPWARVDSRFPSYQAGMPGASMPPSGVAVATDGVYWRQQFRTEAGEIYEMTECQEERMAATDLENTNLKLDSYRDGGAMRRLPADAEVTLTFQDGAAGGKSGCNRYRCAVTIGDDSLVFGPAMGTKMACPPPLME